MSVCDEHSEEEFGKPVIENGDSTTVDPPKFKRRKVSAVRDFPEECGPFGSADDMGVEVKSGKDLGGGDSGEADSPNDEKDPQTFEFNEELFVADTVEQTSDCSLKKEDPVVLSDQVDVGSFANDEPAKVELVSVEAMDISFETEDCSLKKEDPVVSSHRVDGDILVNDEASKVELVGMEAVDMELQTEDCSLRKEDPMVSSYQLDMPILDNNEDTKLTLVGMEILDAELATESCSLKNENAAILSYQIDESTLANDGPAELALVGMETSDMEFTTEGSVKQDLSYISEALAPVGEVAMSDNSKSLLSNINIGGSGACMKEALTKRYPPRKKVAALRDFPRLCGRNAPRLSQDECLKELASLKEVAATDLQEVENNKRKFANLVEADFEGNAVKKLDVAEPSTEMRLALDNHHQVKAENMNTVKVEGTSELDIDYPELESSLKVSPGRKVVLGLRATSECPLESDICSPKFKPTSIGGTDDRKGKKVDFYAHLDRSKTATKSKGVMNHSGHQPLKKKRENSSSDDMGQLVTWEKNSLDPNENNKHFKSVPKPRGYVNVFPLGRSNLSGHESDSVARNKVRKTLRLFQAVCRKLLQEAEAKPKSNVKESKRVDLQASKILKEKGSYVNEGEKIMGSVPGVEVGDEFQYRVELNIIGLHRQIQGGIDYMKQKNKVLATSIVASGGYADDLDNADVLIYTGQGGNVMSSDKEPEDQKLERGNLALKNSSEVKNSVRVIRGSESADGKSRIYVYDGLYEVESYWQDMGPHGKLVYKFRLRRKPGQPELAWKELKKSKKLSKTREGLSVVDISYGKEKIPICAVNTIDNEKPPPFKYITKMMYPDCCNIVPPKGCNCTNGCSDHEKCSCVLKNGGEIPFNHNGAIVEAKPLVYECGPKCKCPPTCYNRVSQLGINIQLEIFKTKSMGWGVRSLNSIPSGSFICEYIGEVLEDKEAEQRTGNDEYLFDIGNNKNNSNLWDGLSNLLPDSHLSSSEVVNDVGFTIDAAQFGNVGRFINHSCSPNLYAQNVLYDHHDNRVPHVMLFAAENIPPLQELTYDYNYTIDQVRDSDGKIKKKYCFCGSVECTGFLYRR